MFHRLQKHRPVFVTDLRESISEMLFYCFYCADKPGVSELRG